MFDTGTSLEVFKRISRPVSSDCYDFVVSARDSRSAAGAIFLWGDLYEARCYR